MNNLLTKLASGLCILCTFSLITACSTQEQSIEESTTMLTKNKMSNVTLVNRDNDRSATSIDNSFIESVHSAWENRERRYEKLLPLFEYELHFDMDGEKQVWKVNKSGYLMKNGSSELYKMDMSVLQKHLN